ncbi:MAG: ABC transporter ATP-binding protein [Candidatus Binatia bacterium]
MAEPLVVIRDLWKIYRLGAAIEVPALRGIDLDIHAGEFVAIMGASGSGKSTLMHILGCLDRPTRGAYRFAGADVPALSADARAELRNRRIGFVFQSFNLLPRTTALENVELPLVYSDTPAAAQRARARAALAIVGLTAREQHLPNQLSGGQQQRVAIARALVNEPSLLLADEPTGNLDSDTTAEIMDIVAALHRERGLTVVLVTHEAEVAAWARRVITFRDGVIVTDVRNPAPTAERRMPALEPEPAR